MAVTLAITMIPPTDPIAKRRARIASNLKLTSMCFEGKKSSFGFVQIDEFTIQRQWKDREAAEEYIDFIRDLETRYGVKLVKADLKGE